MSHTAPSFLLLPGKIRNQIYNYVWSDETVTFTLTHGQFLHPMGDSSEILATEDSSSDEDVEEDFYRTVRCKGSILKDGPLVFIHTRTHFRPSTQTGIRGTCRQIYKETVAVFYGKSYFFYNLWKTLMRSSICNCHRIRYSLTIQIVSTGNHYGLGFVATKALLKSYQTQQYQRRSRSSLWNGIVLQLTALSISFVPSQPQKAGFATRSATKLACITPTDITERGPKQHVHSIMTTKRLVYDKKRKEARLRSIGKIRKGEDNTFYWCWRLRPGKSPSPQPAHGLLPEPDLSTLSLTEEGSTRENDSTSD